MKKPNLNTILIIAITILTIVNTYLILSDKGILQVKINESITNHVAVAKREVVEELMNYQVNGIDGKDGVDGNSVQGPRGEKGEKGDKGDIGASGKDGVTEVIHRTVEPKESPKGEKGDPGYDGKDGLTPMIRCNESKNRWEVRYSDLEKWGLLGGAVVKCTIKENE